MDTNWENGDQNQSLLSRFVNLPKELYTIFLASVACILIIIVTLDFMPSAKFRFIVQSKTIPPDDFDGKVQWATQRIRAPAVWEITTGSPSVRVAVVGTGIDTNHADLRGNVILGYNAMTLGGTTQDDSGRDTMVAGIVGAVGNNGQNIAGLNLTKQCFIKTGG